MWKSLSEGETVTVCTIIIVCSECGGFFLAKEDQKRRTCPYCGETVLVEKAKKLASAANAYEASEILRKLKSSAVSKRKDAKYLS